MPSDYEHAVEVAERRQSIGEDALRRLVTEAHEEPTLGSYLVRLAAADALRGKSAADERRCRELVEAFEAWAEALPPEEREEAAAVTHLSEVEFGRRPDFWSDTRPNTLGHGVPRAAFRKGLRATAVPAKGASHVTIIVHGTWAHIGDPPRWYQPGAKFYEFIREHEADSSHVMDFWWSGKNTDGARFDAVVAFAEFVRELQADEVSVIAHSHGVNVALDATDVGLQYTRTVALSAPFRNAFAPDDPTRVGALYNIQAEVDFVVAFARGTRNPAYPVPELYEYIELEGECAHSRSHDVDVWKKFALGPATGLWPAPE